MIVGVVGGTGFIGRWIAAVALQRGDAVHLTSRRGAGGLLAHPRLHVATLDASDDAGVASWLHGVQPDVLVNAIGYGVDPTERDEDMAVHVNTDWPTRLVTLLAARAPRARLVHLGSAQEYGDVTGDLAEDGPVHPTTSYGRTKLAGTQALHAEAARTGVAVTTARLFTVVGPGEHRARLLPSLLRAAREEGPLPLSAGTARRDFAFAGDVAEAVLDLGAIPAAAGQVVNVATGTLHEVREFVRLAAHQLGIAPARLGFGALPTRPDEMRHDPVRVRRLEGLRGSALPGDLDAAIARALAARVPLALAT